MRSTRCITMTLEQHLLVDEGAEDTPRIPIIVEVTPEGVFIRVVSNPDVYVGVEVWDGTLRGTFGPKAEIVSLDMGIIVAEEITNGP